MKPCMTQIDPDRVMIEPHFFSPEAWVSIQPRTQHEEVVRHEIEYVIKREAKRRGYILLDDIPPSSTVADFPDEVLPDHWGAGDWLRFYWHDSKLFICRIHPEVKRYSTVMFRLPVGELCQELVVRLTPVVEYYRKHQRYGSLDDMLNLWFRYVVLNYYGIADGIDARIVRYFQYPGMERLRACLLEYLDKVDSNDCEFCFQQVDYFHTTLSLIFQRRVTNG